jgi:hypothetical protein
MYVYLFDNVLDVVLFVEPRPSKLVYSQILLHLYLLVRHYRVFCFMLFLSQVAEASNAQRFNELYAGITDVFVPKIYSDFTTAKVLTMEWVDGFRLTDDANMNLYNLDKSKMVDTLVQCSLKQILENGMVFMKTRSLVSSLV